MYQFSSTCMTFPTTNPPSPTSQYARTPGPLAFSTPNSYMPLITNPASDCTKRCMLFYRELSQVCRVLLGSEKFVPLLIALVFLYSVFSPLLDHILLSSQSVRILFLYYCHSPHFTFIPGIQYCHPFT
jgi:hypothetical protein